MSERAVVVCTTRRGVFFGFSADTSGIRITLRNAQMCVYWSAETRGVLGLAATGPAKGSRVTKPVPLGEIRGVTAVLDCTPEAVARWQEMPWS